MASRTVGFIYFLSRQLFKTCFACRPPALVTHMKGSVSKGGLSHRDMCKAASTLFNIVRNCTIFFGVRNKDDPAVVAANSD